MTVHTDAGPQRWGIYTRRHRREPWRLVVSHGDKRAAERLLIDLAATAKTSGDWKVSAVGSMESAGPVGVSSGSEPTGRGRR